MQIKVTEKSWASDNLLQFTRIAEGTPQLKITANIPVFVKQAYEAAESGTRESVESILHNIDSDIIASHLESGHYNVQVVFLLALTYTRIDAWEQAEACFLHILRLCPDAMVYHELNRICMLTGRVDKACEYRKQAYEAAPENPMLCCNHATDLFRLGNVQDGIRVLWQAANGAPHNAKIGSRYLKSLGYLAEHCRENLKEAHKQWAGTHTSLESSGCSGIHDFNTRRALRIGYLLPDIRRSTVGYGIDALLHGYNQHTIKLFAYINEQVVDEVGLGVRKRFACWRSISKLDDCAAAKLIADDRIDILVAADGHSFLSRLGVLAYQPAPVQIEYGALCPTPMKQINFHLEEWIDADDSESSVSSLFCYKPDSVLPEVTSLPALRNGYVTFASFNTSYKITEQMLTIWSEILKQVEDSRLLLKLKGGYDRQIRQLYLDKFHSLGISSDRIEIHGWQMYSEYLELLTQADIGLDTYPNNGRTTLMEALWMGVPFISRTDSGSDLFMSRLGGSLLKSVDLDCMSCETDSKYIETAVLLARKTEALAVIRKSLRTRMTKPAGLCDCRAFALRLEKAFRRMWKSQCSKIKLNF